MNMNQFGNILHARANNWLIHIVRVIKTKENSIFKLRNKEAAINIMIK